MHYLDDYKTFESKAELNNAIYLHIRNNTHVLNETDRAVLKMVARYAVKYYGAAHLKAATIADYVGKSEKTVRRVVNKLVALEIIEKYATLRKINGGKGANILVILPAAESLAEEGVPNSVYNSVNKFTIDANREDLTEASTGASAEREAQRDQSILSSREGSENSDNAKAEERYFEEEPSYSIKHLKSTYKDTRSPVPANALRSALPHAIYNAMEPFFNAEEIYKYYGLLLKAKRKVSPNTLIEHDPEPYIETFNAVMLKLKQGKIRNLERYLYVAFEKAAATVARKLNLERSSDSRSSDSRNSLSLFSEWLAAE
jgi:DNA-binding Lrp family transcriptional regulator